MSRFSEVKELIDSLEQDFTKFYEQGNKAAGTRVRNGMQTIKTLAQDIRTEVQEIKNKDK
ncbi:histone H1 [Echinicola salinicaeni]|uniref:histone H1 n=1 Tax=Echinicola salinicaeni TaxID=2762757 RepID=UPI00164533E9|nr:histone H1 [Echinicola salinicaeni]